MPVNPSTHEVTIGDNVFYIRRFPAFLALEILGELQKQFAGPLISSVDGKESIKDAEGNPVLDANGASKMMQGFVNLSNKLDGKTLRRLAETLITKDNISVSIDGANPRPLDAPAQGLAIETAADILTLCWEVIKFNYAEVITRLSSPTGPARAFLSKM